MDLQLSAVSRPVTTFTPACARGRERSGYEGRAGAFHERKGTQRLVKPPTAPEQDYEPEDE